MRNIDVKKAIQIVCLTEGRGWAHTSGLSAFGLPEVEIVDVPRFMYGAAASILNAIADLMLNGSRPVREGDLVDTSPRFTARVIASPDRDHPLYHATKVWRLVDFEGSCECDQCRDERTLAS